MEITRDIILDLLPVYLADEASDDTRALVDTHLAADPELAAIARQSADVANAEEPLMIPQREQKLEAYLEAKRLQQRTTVTWAVIIGVGLFGFLSLAALLVLMFMRTG